MFSPFAGNLLFETKFSIVDFFAVQTKWEKVPHCKVLST
jgi:hypothetical protein